MSRHFLKEHYFSKSSLCHRVREIAFLEGALEHRLRFGRRRRSSSQRQLGDFVCQLLAILFRMPSDTNNEGVLRNVQNTYSFSEFALEFVFLQDNFVHDFRHYLVDRTVQTKRRFRVFATVNSQVCDEVEIRTMV